MSDSMEKYWEDLISQMPAFALVESSLFVDSLLNLRELVDSDLVDFFLKLSDMLHVEGFLRYSKIVQGLIVSGKFSLDLFSLVS